MAKHTTNSGQGSHEARVRQTAVGVDNREEFPRLPIESRAKILSPRNSYATWFKVTGRYTRVSQLA